MLGGLSRRWKMFDPDLTPKVFEMSGIGETSEICSVCLGYGNTIDGV